MVQRRDRLLLQYNTTNHVCPLRHHRGQSLAEIGNRKEYATEGFPASTSTRASRCSTATGTCRPDVWYAEKPATRRRIVRVQAEEKTNNETPTYERINNGRRRREWIPLKAARVRKAKARASLEQHRDLRPPVQRGQRQGNDQHRSGYRNRPRRP